MSIKKDVVKLIEDIIEDGKYSNIQMNYIFSKNSYTRNEKAFINNIVNVTIKNLMYIDYIIESLAKSPKRYIKQILRVSLAQILYTSADYKGVVFEAVEIAKEYNEFQAKFVNSFLRNFIEKKEELEINAPLNVKLSYPKWFVEKMKIEFGEDKYLDVLRRYKQNSYFSVRVNHKKLSKDNFIKLVKDVESEILFEVDNVYYLNNNKITKTRDYLLGNIHIQDGSSNLVVKILNVKDTDLVYDAAAAPGGKSLAILEGYNPLKLVATDIHEHKVNMLKEFEKDYANFEAICSDATKFNQGMYDKILLDVPCSGIGVLTKKPEKIYKLKQNDVKEIKKIQKKIFDNVYKLLKEGGELVYSTCTILQNENTNNLEYFLNKYPELEVVDVEFPKEVKIIKDRFGGNLISYENKYLDGFYIVKLKKGKN
ncbi:16S rRNA (cytosine(967)-C(5))-methyltransferase RsmB [Pseudostreptobacillus hongkongensis]|uniref:16S rRNA (cytosine(967)-C(5))-methyltransferase RsmB n=1 Tax=Pseudostreptobacillus hongkongensis TaxID=1162717 RepID=UPI00083739FF|nr:16S rRNA (cytosine(967)-C(5))-methyltransferase RsmB [Pseudostreptobacillus hongkongensis]